METNRDIYQSIAAILRGHENKPVISLEQYLISLWFRAQKWKQEKEISVETFLALLTDAFIPVEANLDENSGNDGRTSGFAGWDSLIRRQIQDLREMKANGQLENEERFYGMDAPSGNGWYNFDPCGYIECGTEGSLGGWEEGDETGREYVLGKVAALNEKGEIIECDPQDLVTPHKEIKNLSWDKFKDFLYCGQVYE